MVFIGDALADDAGFLVDENGHQDFLFSSKVLISASKEITLELAAFCRDDCVCLETIPQMRTASKQIQGPQ